MSSDWIRFSTWLNDRFDGKRWVIAARLTPKLELKGYQVAIPSERFEELEREFKAAHKVKA